MNGHIYIVCIAIYRLKAFPSTIRNKTRTSTFTIYIHIVLKVLSGTSSKKIKHPNWKERKKTPLTAELVYRKSQRIHQKMSTANKLSKVTSSTNKYVIFLYISNEQSKKEIKKMISFEIQLKG